MGGREGIKEILREWEMRVDGEGGRECPCLFMWLGNVRGVVEELFDLPR